MIFDTILELVIQKDQKQHTITTLILQAFEVLLRQTINFCDANNLNLTQCSPAFETNQINDWLYKLLQIYSHVYKFECERFYKTQKAMKVKGIPDQVMTTSKSVKQLILVLADRHSQQKLIQDNLIKIQEKVNDQVFQEPIDIVPLEFKSEKIKKQTKNRSSIDKEHTINLRFLNQTLQPHDLVEQRTSSGLKVEKYLKNKKSVKQFEKVKEKLEAIYAVDQTYPRPILKGLKRQNKRNSDLPQVNTTPPKSVKNRVIPVFLEHYSFRSNGQVSFPSLNYNPRQDKNDSEISDVNYATQMLPLLQQPKSKFKTDQPTLVYRQQKLNIITKPVTVKLSDVEFVETQGKEQQPKQVERTASPYKLLEIPIVQSPTKHRQSRGGSPYLRKWKKKLEYNSNYLSDAEFQHSSESESQKSARSSTFKETFENIESPEKTTSLVNFDRNQWWLRQHEDIPSHMLMFDLDDEQSKFQFNLMGIFNTKRDENSWYKVVAEFGGKKFDFCNTDWNKTTTTSWRFIQQKDHLLDAIDLQLNEYNCIIYRVQKYDILTKQTNEKFGFAVQPLISKIKDRTFLVQGQYQLPVYTGDCPEQILNGSKEPEKILKQQLASGNIQTMDYVQLVARVSQQGSKECYANMWHPNVEPSMNQMTLLNQAKLVCYVMYANHMKDEKKIDKIKNMIEAELFQDSLDIALKTFFI